MNVNNLDKNLPFLTAADLLKHTSVLDAVKTRTIKCIDRLQADVDKRKADAASRWKGTDSFGLNPTDRARIEGTEVAAAIRQVRQNAEAEIDGLMKEAGAAHAAVVSQRSFYDSPVKTLNRASLGKPERSEYMRQVESVGPAELTHLAQFAVSTKNNALGAAIVSRLDTMPPGSRPFTAVALASAMDVAEHHKGSEAIKLSDLLLQQVLIACRTWRQGQSNPLNTVQLAMQGKDRDFSLLENLESEDA